MNPRVAMMAVAIWSGVFATSSMSGAQVKEAKQPTASGQLQIEVYLCTSTTYTPWIRRSSRPRDYNPYRYSAHIEVYLPQLEVAYLPSSETFISCDRKRYAEDKSKIGQVALDEGNLLRASQPRSETQVQVRKIPALTLATHFQDDVLERYKEYIRSGTPTSNPDSGD